LSQSAFLANADQEHGRTGWQNQERLLRYYQKTVICRKWFYSLNPAIYESHHLLDVCFDGHG